MNVLWLVQIERAKGRKKEGKARASKCKRKKADNMKTDITKVRMNRLCWWNIAPSKTVMSIHKRVKIHISYYYILFLFINFINEFSIYILCTPSYFSLQLLFLLILNFMTFVLNYYCYTHLYSYVCIYVYTHIQSSELIKCCSYRYGLKTWDWVSSSEVHYWKVLVLPLSTATINL